MSIKKVMNSIIIILTLGLIVGIGLFIYNTMSAYKISSDFISIPLQYNPYDSSSTYDMPNAQIKVYGGFIKGIQKDKDGTNNLLIRALSPLPSIMVKGKIASTLPLVLENINPDFYAKSIASSGLSITKTKVNTLKLEIPINVGESIVIKPVQTSDKDSSGKYKYIILGDNRDGYDTFGQIIQQVNGEKPVFVIDNGDLVYSGKPNQYRLFDNMVSHIEATLCTTLGNHDIRRDGRSTYTELYGPAYYSFDFQDSHFVFLDSSRGWAEAKSISDEQYAWLEHDLINAQGKKIFVISHIPPTDPRRGTTPNLIANYIDQTKKTGGWVEQKLDNYSVSKSMNHGFQDVLEAAKFEKLMSTYHVDTVYLSHIHSYLEYTKGGVRYLISGGAGAELLTENSYYHYMIAKIGDVKTITMVELPSPKNNYLTRYSATIQLFAEALYKENPTSVILVISSLILLILMLMARFYLWKKRSIDTISRWLLDIGKYAVKRFKELFKDSDIK